MHVEISGHHVEVTDALRQAIHQKLEKLVSHYPDMNACHVTLTVERNAQVVEINTNYLGSTIAVEASNHDMYAAIADVTKKLDAKLSHKKGCVKSHRPQKAATN